MMKTTYLLFVWMVLAFASCKKYLDAKPDKSLATPSSLADLQALLDNNNVMNVTAGYGEASADNYYLLDEDYDALSTDGDRNLYTWGDEITYDQYPNDWSHCYDAVYYANVVLENIGNIPKDNAGEWDNIKGSALFFRAKAFQGAVFTWAKAFDSSSAGKDLGIPLRLTSDFNIPSQRASVLATYNQVISDLLAAAPLLLVTPSSVMRPSRPAAYVLLSNTYLAMGAYQKAGVYADSALQLTHGLLDYNTLNPSSGAPVNRFNNEVIFHCNMLGTDNLYYGHADSTLYGLYDDNDLRKKIFFDDYGDGSYYFKGNYNQNGNFFTGVTTMEMYLVSAECAARTGNKLLALKDINDCMPYRYKTGTWKTYTSDSLPEILVFILNERRKELVFRDSRWIDIKRLNKEGVFPVSITRFLHNTTLQLTPNDPRYALPLPSQVIVQSGMQQNPR